MIIGNYSWVSLGSPRLHHTKPRPPVSRVNSDLQAVVFLERFARAPQDYYFSKQE